MSEDSSRRNAGDDIPGERHRVRFAPSPTGRLHLGSARTALFNWLVARGSGGTMVLRLEDTDRQRSSEEFEHDITGSLRWLGIDWDEGPEMGGPHGPYRQSERMGIYREHAARLLESGRAYRCFCTPQELDARKKEAVSGGGTWRYDRRCLALSAEESERRSASGEPWALRFRVPEGTVEVRDLLRGSVTVEASEIDDFIILRSDGTAGFHLAVVVDDLTMEIDLVIRGDDHLTNAVRHVMLFRALGAEPPEYIHHSLLMGPDGAKLSKRHGATAVSDYRARGYLPEALANYLALLSWSPGDDREIFRREDLVHEFSIEGVSASKAVFDFDKLKWLNRQHMRRLSDPELTDVVVPFLERAAQGLLDTVPPEERDGVAGASRSLLELPRDKLEVAVSSVRDGMETLSDAVEPMGIFAVPPGEISPEARSELDRSEDLLEALEMCVQVLGRETTADMDSAERVVTALREGARARGWKAKQVLWPFRLAVTGRTVGPDLLYLIMFWGPGGCADRIRSVI